MGEATDALNAIKPKEALPHEQDALELLTKAMMELDKVLTQMRSNGSQAAADNIEMDMEDLQDAIEQDENELDEQMAEQTQELLDQARRHARSTGTTHGTEPAVSTGAAAFAARDAAK